jgi:hypothetical protein
MLLASFLNLPSILLGLRSHTEIFFIVGFVILYFLVQTAREKWRVYRSRGWPTAVGAIAKLGYEKVDGGLNGVDYWKVRIDYTYSALAYPVAHDPAQAQHSGHYCFNVTSDEQANGAIAGLNSKTVSVHYNPAKPEKGVLWEDEVWDIWWDTYWQLAHPEEAEAK